MNGNSLLQIMLFLALVLACVKPLGWYMARVYEGKTCGIDKIMKPFERFIYRSCRINPQQEMDWKTYSATMLVFNLLGLLAAYAIQRLQGYLPLNTQDFSAVPRKLMAGKPL